MLKLMSELTPVLVTETPVPTVKEVPPERDSVPDDERLAEFPMLNGPGVVMESAPTMLMEVDADIENPPFALHANEVIVGAQFSEPLKVMALVAVTDGVAPVPIVVSQYCAADGSIIQEVTIQS